MPHRLLRHIGQHGIGTAEGHNRHLTEKHALLNIDVADAKPAIENNDRGKPQQSAEKRARKAPWLAGYTMVGNTAVYDAFITGVARSSSSESVGTRHTSAIKAAPRMTSGKGTPNTKLARKESL